MNFANNGQILKIPVKKIRPSSVQPRMNISEDSLKGLAETIKSGGQEDPILVKKLPVPENGAEFELVHGERRLRSVTISGKDTVDARIVEVKDRIEQLLIPLIAQIHTKELSWFELAHAVKKLDSWAMTQSEISEKLGQSQNLIRKYIQFIDDLSPEALAFAHPKVPEEKRLSEGQAGLLLVLPKEKQAEFAKTFSENGLSLKEAKNLIEKIAKEQNIPLSKKPKETGSSARTDNAKPFKALEKFVMRTEGHLDKILGMNDTEFMKILEGPKWQERSKLLEKIEELASKATELAESIKRIEKNRKPSENG